MKYDTREEFLSYIKFMKELGFLKIIGQGSQGICYHNLMNNQVYKIFHQFFDEDDDFFEYFHVYTKEEILKFSNINNDTFVWAKDVIIVNDEIVGYISDYVDAKSLYKINPLIVNLNHFTQSINTVENDLMIISNNGVVTYDMAYNTLYGKNGIFVIDHDDYSYANIDSEKLFRRNCDNFNYEIMLFLIDNYFDEFITSYKELREMYNSKGININDFIILFRKYLSEYVGHEIVKLKEASKCLNKHKITENKYERILFD